MHPALIISLALFFTGCTSTGPTHTLSAAGKNERQKARDVSECMAMSNNGSAIPTYRYRPPPTVYGSNAGAALSGFSYGINNATSMMAANEARQRQTMIHENCLISRGWKRIQTK